MGAHLLVAAIAAADAAVADNIARGEVIRDRLRSLQEQLDAGRPLAQIVDEEGSPHTVELLTENAAALDDAGARFRSRLAQALRDEGLTIEAIATRFGVTRQRVSALLRQRTAD